MSRTLSSVTRPPDLITRRFRYGPPGAAVPGAPAPGVTPARRAWPGPPGGGSCCPPPGDGGKRGRQLDGGLEPAAGGGLDRQAEIVSVQTREPGARVGEPDPGTRRIA